MTTLPELPEVETIRRQLAPCLRGRRIAHVEVLDPRLTAPVAPATFKRSLKGRMIKSVGRRGKYLLLGLDDGNTLVLHLRMTGVLTWSKLPLAREGKKHLRVVLRFDDGSALTFDDVRRFGTAMIIPWSDSDGYWRRLGVEPLERSFTGKTLEQMLDGRKRPVKSLLLDQSLIAGIGNIYADEALYAAGILPQRRSGEISGEEAAILAKAIKETLRRAIRLQGSSIDTYRDSRGRSGRFQETFRVHRREGEPCPGCQGTIVKTRVGGRGTYYCPSCQK